MISSTWSSGDLVQALDRRHCVNGKKKIIFRVDVIEEEIC
jgi:hypothetical protein